MTEKNMYTIMFDSELPGTPEQVLGGFKDGKTTYAKIFECLCRYILLDILIIWCNTELLCIRLDIWNKISSPAGMSHVICILLQLLWSSLCNDIGLGERC